jgi:NAD(P)-dependent dehydrogenase (short-subunit alcohol dehydrogenase family)
MTAVHEANPDVLLRRPPLTSRQVPGLEPGVQFRLDRRVALVTGAGGELGGWLAAGLGAAGARVLLTDVDAPALEATAGALERAGVSVSTATVDLVQEGAPVRCVAAALEAFGRLDVLVNGAAVNRREALLDVEPETFDRIMAVDLRAPYLLAQAAARTMIAAGRGGAIVNVGSINVAVGLQGVSVYGAAKAALGQLTKVLAVELAEHGIRANCLCPGFMASRLSEPVWRDPARRSWLLARIPQRRPGRPDELVGALLLLASDAGAYLTGQTLFVDGGFLAGSPWDPQP